VVKWPGSHRSPVTVPAEMVKSRLERVNRVHVYRPAKLWMHVLFLSSIGSAISTIVAAYHAWALGGMDGLLNAFWYVVPLSVASGWGVSKSSLDYLIATGFFLFEGDLGFVNLDSIELRHPILTQVTYPVNTDERKRHYAAEVWNKNVTRYEVWRWGRRGGVWKWPLWDGGKREGYWAVIQHSWEVADVLIRECPSCKKYEERTDAKFCPSCGSDAYPKGKPGVITKVISGAPLATKVENERILLSEKVAEEMRNRLPGILRGRVLDLRYVIWPNRSPLELPEEVAQAIMSDSEYRSSSLVSVGYDQLSEEVYLGTVAPPNALARLWGTEVAFKSLVEEYTVLSNRVAKLRILQELQYTGGQGIGGPGGGGQTGEKPGF